MGLEHGGVRGVRAGGPDAGPAPVGGHPLGVRPLRPLHPWGRRATDCDGPEEQAQTADSVRQVQLV